MLSRQPSEELWAEPAFHDLLFWNRSRGGLDIVIILIIFMIFVIVIIIIIILTIIIIL